MSSSSYPALFMELAPQTLMGQVPIPAGLLTETSGCLYDNSLPESPVLQFLLFLLPKLGAPWKHGVLSIALWVIHSCERKMFSSASLFFVPYIFKSLCLVGPVLQYCEAKPSLWLNHEVQSHTGQRGNGSFVVLCSYLTHTAGLLHHPGQAQLSACMEGCRQQHVSISQGCCTGWFIHEHL